MSGPLTVLNLFQVESIFAILRRSLSSVEYNISASTLEKR